MSGLDGTDHSTDDTNNNSTMNDDISHIPHNASAVETKQLMRARSKSKAMLDALTPDLARTMVKLYNDYVTLVHKGHSLTSDPFSNGHDVSTDPSIPTYPDPSTYTKYDNLSQFFGERNRYMGLFPYALRSRLRTIDTLVSFRQALSSGTISTKDPFPPAYSLLLVRLAQDSSAPTTRSLAETLYNVIYKSTGEELLAAWNNAIDSSIDYLTYLASFSIPRDTSDISGLLLSLPPPPASVEADAPLICAYLESALTVCLECKIYTITPPPPLPDGILELAGPQAPALIPCSLTSPLELYVWELYKDKDDKDQGFTFRNESFLLEQRSKSRKLLDTLYKVYYTLFDNITRCVSDQGKYQSIINKINKQTADYKDTLNKNVKKLATFREKFVKEVHKVTTMSSNIPLPSIVPSNTTTSTSTSAIDVSISASSSSSSQNPSTSTSSATPTPIKLKKASAAIPAPAKNQKLGFFAKFVQPTTPSPPTIPADNSTATTATTTSNGSNTAQHPTTPTFKSSTQNYTGNLFTISTPSLNGPHAHGSQTPTLVTHPPPPQSNSLLNLGLVLAPGPTSVEPLAPTRQAISHTGPLTFQDKASLYLAEQKRFLPPIDPSQRSNTLVQAIRRVFLPYPIGSETYSMGRAPGVPLSTYSNYRQRALSRPQTLPSSYLPIHDLSSPTFKNSNDTSSVLAHIARYTPDTESELQSSGGIVDAPPLDPTFVPWCKANIRLTKYKKDKNDAESNRHLALWNELDKTTKSNDSSSSSSSSVSAPSHDVTDTTAIVLTTPSTSAARRAAQSIDLSTPSPATRRRSRYAQHQQECLSKMSNRTSINHDNPCHLNDPRIMRTSKFLYFVEDTIRPPWFGPWPMYLHRTTAPGANRRRPPILHVANPLLPASLVNSVPKINPRRPTEHYRAIKYHSVESEDEYEQYERKMTAPLDDAAVQSGSDPDGDGDDDDADIDDDDVTDRAFVDNSLDTDPNKQHQRPLTMTQIGPQFPHTMTSTWGRLEQYMDNNGIPEPLLSASAQALYLNSRSSSPPDYQQLRSSITPSIVRPRPITFANSKFQHPIAGTCWQMKRPRYDMAFVPNQIIPSNPKDAQLMGLHQRHIPVKAIVASYHEPMQQLRVLGPIVHKPVLPPFHLTVHKFPGRRPNAVRGTKRKLAQIHDQHNTASNDGVNLLTARRRGPSGTTTTTTTSSSSVPAPPQPSGDGTNVLVPRRRTVAPTPIE